MYRKAVAVALVSLLGLAAGASAQEVPTQIDEAPAAQSDTPGPTGPPEEEETREPLDAPATGAELPEPAAPLDDPLRPDLGPFEPVTPTSEEVDASVDAQLAPRESMIRADRPQLQLSLSEAVELTLSKSLAPRVREVERVEALAALEGSKAGFDPLAESELSGVGVQRSTTSGLESNSGQLVTKDYTLRSSLTQALPMGGRYQIAMNTNRSASNSQFSLLPSDYSTSLTATLSYPLLQDRGNRTLKMPIRRAENNVELSELNLRNEVMGAVSRTQDDYLDLILAIENLKVQEQSLALAKNLLSIAQAQERVGTLAPIEVLSAEAGVAAREETVILAESAVLAAEDVLRTSLNLPENLGMWNVGIVPTDVPGLPAQTYDFGAAVQRAFELRPDYQQAKVNLRTQRLEVDLQRDQSRPTLDLIGSFGFVGNSQIGVGLDEEGNPTGVRQGGILGSHIEDLLSMDNFVWNIGVNVRQPLGNRAALGSYRVEKLELERELLLLRNLELAIVSEVRALLRNIETNRKRVAATRVAAELARRRLEAEEKKFEVGTATSFDVLQFQEQYVRAATSQTQAIIDLDRSTLQLQESLGLTLEANGITIENGRPIFRAADSSSPRRNAALEPQPVVVPP